jgi:hypothetical protein
MSIDKSRRRVLRGMMNGAAVTVALPFLECFLNNNGDALASGAPLPVRFGTWFWGLGMNSEIFAPKKFGAGYELPEQLASLQGVSQHVNIFSNFDVLTDGRPNLCHYTGWVGLRTGEAPTSLNVLPRESFDVTVSDVIGNATRFRSIQLAATGNPRSSYSFRNQDAVNPPDVSPVDFYQRIFGPEFQDPNSPIFTPDPRVMTRKSVLSAVMEESTDFRASLGKADQVRLDEYFTATRALEKRLALLLEKPAPAPACIVQKAPEKELAAGLDVELLGARHNMMADILVMALACNQTNVFNVLYSEAISSTTRKGAPRPHHPETHEEPKDDKLGYQIGSAWYATRAIEAWSHLVKAMANFKEGDGTLLDRSLVVAHSDCSLAQTHQLTGLPMMTAGSASGRVKTGLHVDGKASPVTRLCLTTMQVMGLQIAEWGQGSMKTSQPVGEILV